MMWSLIGNLASLAAIIGVSGSDLAGQWKPWIALGAFLACMVFIAWRARKAFDQFSRQHYPRGYLPLSSFVRYTTSDGMHVTFEAFRHIQIKTAYQKTFKHQFQWTGSKDPAIKSDLQKVSEIHPIDGEVLKEVTLTFPRVRMFNDVEVIHIQMAIDDSDGKGKPFLRQKVEHPVRLLNFRVELLHTNKAYHGQVATVKRISINKPNAKTEEITTVPFEVMTRSYAYQIVDPEPGFQYEICWCKPAIPVRRR